MKRPIKEEQGSRKNLLSSLCFSCFKESLNPCLCFCRLVHWQALGVKQSVLRVKGKELTQCVHVSFFQQEFEGRCKGQVSNQLAHYP